MSNAGLAFVILDVKLLRRAIVLVPEQHRLVFLP
jgi:hypothetical protein